MNIVIKGTKTVIEYKKLKSFMEKKANEYYRNHKNACEDWKEGNIAKVWIDEQDNLCIKYESGSWWHYNEKGEWW